MRGDELTCLKRQKYHEGKDRVEVYEEIETLKESQIVLKNNKLEIKHLVKENKKLKEENESLKNQVFNLQFKIVSASKPIIEEVDNIQYLKLIMLTLNGDKRLTKRKIAKEIKVVEPKTKKCLDFLERYNCIKSKGVKGGKEYWRE